MANLRIPLYDISKFTWDKNHGVTEASMLDNEFFSRVWHGAADVGFHVVGKTMTLLFLLQDIEQQDCDIVSWKFNARAFDGSEFTIRIYND